jgi:NitT/TauT family transport system substrate-binding protein
MDWNALPRIEALLLRCAIKTGRHRVVAQSMFNLVMNLRFMRAMRPAARRSWLAAGLLAVSLASCAPARDHTVVVGTNIWPGYDPGYLAEREGLYKGIEVDMRQMLSASDLLAAFRNGSVDVAAFTLDEALKLQQQGFDVRVFMVVDISNGQDAIVARPSIGSVKDLQGKSVAVENTALGAYVLLRALEQNGVAPESVKQVSMTIDESVQYYKSGKVAAVVSMDPYLSRMKREGGKVIFDSSEIPDEVVDVLVTTKAYAQTYPDDLRALVNGWSAAVKLIKEDRKGTTVIPGIAKRLNITPAELLATYGQMKLLDARGNADMLIAGGQVEKTAIKMLPLLEQIEGRPMKADPRQLITPDAVF